MSNSQKDKYSKDDILNLRILSVLVIIIIIGGIYFGFINESEDSSDIYITQSGFVASQSEDYLEKAVQFSIDNDKRAFNELISSGYIFELPSNKEVYVVKSKIGKVKIRFKGGRKEVWVLSEAIYFKN